MRIRAIAQALVVLVVSSSATLAATITVTSTADDLGAGANGNCTLREALRAANLNVAVDACPAGTVGLVATDTVVVPAGTYVLEAAGRYEDAGLTGDLDVFDKVQIQGADAATTVIDAGDLDRVMHLRGVAIGLSDITLTGGSAIHHEPEAGESQSPLGGGVLVEQNADVTITDTVIRDNSALDGGGIQNLGGIVRLVRSTVSGNFAALDLTFPNYESGFSGGIGNDGPTAVVDIIDSTISENTAQLGGAGISNAFFGLGGSMSIAGSTISANTALGAAASGFPWPPTGGGAGILNDGPLSIVNSTISGNVANSFTVPSSGGGIITGGDTFDAVLVMTNSTVTGNQAATGTALLANTGSITLANTLVQGSCRFLGTGAITSQGGNLESPANGCGFGASTDTVNVADPKLGALAENGGPTRTHALLAGSPALDKGLGPGCPTVDQRGTTRPQPAGGRCDVGAYELVPSTGCGASSPGILLVPLAIALGRRRNHPAADHRRP